MRNLLLLPVLLLGAEVVFPCELVQRDGSTSSAWQAVDEETRTVTLDITGMT